MSQLPCQRCGEPLTCPGNLIGQTIQCTACRVSLRIDEEPSGKPRRRRRLLLPLAIFVAGLALGFQMGAFAGAQQQAQGQRRGIVANAWGLFFAHNQITVEGPAEPPKKEADDR